MALVFRVYLAGYIREVVKSIFDVFYRNI